MYIKFMKDDFDEMYEVLSTLKDKKRKINNTLIEK